MLKTSDAGRTERRRWTSFCDWRSECRFGTIMHEETHELKDIYGPQCSCGFGADPRRDGDVAADPGRIHLQSSVYLVELYDHKEKASTHKAWGKKRRTSQLDDILGPKTCEGMCHIHNVTHESNTLYHYPVYATIKHEEGTMQNKTKKRRTCARWRLLNEEAKAECRRR